MLKGSLKSSKISDRVKLVNLNEDNNSILELINDEINQDSFYGKLSEKEMLRKITRLTATAEGSYGVVVLFDDKPVGFVIAGGNQIRMMYGFKKDVRGLGIAKLAVESSIRYLNLEGYCRIEAEVLHVNIAGTKFIEKMQNTILYKEKDSTIYILHNDPSVFVIERDEGAKGVTVPRKRKAVVPTNEPLYHISFDKNLPEILKPRLPYGDGESIGGEFGEPEWPRVSFSPSPELCFRAVYPNVKHFFERNDFPYLEFTLYRTVGGIRNFMTPEELTNDKFVHDAHITLEYVSRKDVVIEKVGKIRVLNTSDDDGLYYRPFYRSHGRYHSPKKIEIERVSY